MNGNPFAQIKPIIRLRNMLGIAVRFDTISRFIEFGTVCHLEGLGCAMCSVHFLYDGAFRTKWEIKYLFAHNPLWRILTQLKWTPCTFWRKLTLFLFVFSILLVNVFGVDILAIHSSHVRFRFLDVDYTYLFCPQSSHTQTYPSANIEKCTKLRFAFNFQYFETNTLCRPLEPKIVLN